MADTRSTNPLVEQFYKGGVPRELRLMAAQGVLPLKPEDLVELLLLLTRDADADVARSASDRMLALTVAELLPILKDRGTPPEILAWGLVSREERELREVVLQNTSLTDETLVAHSASLSEPLAELVVINQTRLLRCTPLLEAIESNPSLNSDQKRRLRELRETFRIGEQPAEAAPPPAPPPPPPAPSAPEPEEAVEAEPAPLSEEEAIVHYLSEDERTQGEKVSSVQKIYRMTAAEKVITALKGTREERTILIRDPNRIVSTAVLGSPRLTDTEVETFAAMKNVSDEVLRYIGRSKDWTKRYGVVAALVRNPRTPLAISLGMVTRLNPRDLKNVAVDKNVPEAIRKQAQRFVRAATSERER
jgi:hypothetical protein